jgi:hypothetical protein
MLIAAASGPLTEDAPLVGRPKVGDVTGALAPAGLIRELTAVSRVTRQTYPPDAFDPATGRFTFRNLPGDARYDLAVTLTDGRRIEGIDLDFVDQRLLRLAERRRIELGLPPQPRRDFTAADAQAIVTFVADLKDFMDTHRVLYVAGQGPRATALVELIRTQAFHAARPGEILWRMELWYFQFASGAWQRVADQERVLRRERLPLEEWRKIDVTYYPTLSVYVDPDGSSQPVEFTLPSRSDPSRGRSAGSEVALKTAPHLLGITGTTQPATPPAD